MAYRKKTTTKRRRRTYRRRRRNPARNVVTRAANPPRRRYRRRRSNPVLPTGMLRSALMLGAGYLAAPMVTNMIPIQTSTRLGHYAKTAVAATFGGMIVSKVLGRKFGNALQAGAWLWIAVDALQSQVPFFAPGTGADGTGYYFPPNAELAAGALDTSFPNAAGSIADGRLSPRFMN